MTYYLPLKSIDGQINENHIINGDMQVWQRGTSFTFNGTSIITADRMMASVLGSVKTPMTISKGTIPTDDTNIQDGPTSYLRLDTTVGSGVTAPIIEQTIVRHSPVFKGNTDILAGKEVTMSCWIRISNHSATGNFRPYLAIIKDFGVGGSPQEIVGLKYLDTTNNQWQKFEVTTTIPTNEGKTITTIGKSGLTIRIAGPQGDGGANPYQPCTVDITNVKLEVGNSSTPYYHADYGTVLKECMKYYRYYNGGHWLIRTSPSPSFGACIPFTLDIRDMVNTNSFSYSIKDLNNTANQVSLVRIGSGSYEHLSGVHAQGSDRDRGIRVWFSNTYQNPQIGDRMYFRIEVDKEMY